MLKNISFILLTVLCGFSFSQKNERKAWLGAQFEDYKSADTVGVKILKITGGTSQNLKLAERDIITKVDDKSVSSSKLLTSHLKTKMANDKVQIEIYRGGKKIKLSGNYVGKPFETDSNSNVLYDFVNYRNGQLRTIINKPHKNGKMPALLFIPGYTCSSIDGLAKDNPYKRIVEEYIKAGYVTMRIEKSGVGDSKNTPDCELCNLTDEIEGFEKGLLQLKKLPYVDTNNIFIWGHSMGGIVVPALSAKHNVAGVIVYGTTSKSWFEYQLELNRIQSLLAHPDPIENEKYLRGQHEINYRFYVKSEPIEKIAQDPRLDSLLKLGWDYKGDGLAYGRNARYWQQIDELPILTYWKSTKAKVLVLFGESDFQAFSKADHEQIVNTVNFYNQGNATLKTFPETDHYISKSGTMQQAYDKFVGKRYQELFDNFNFDVIKTSIDWSNQVLVK